MKLEPIIQSEIRKEKHQYSILMCVYIYIYIIYKDGKDDPICKAAKEIQR